MSNPAETPPPLPDSLQKERRSGFFVGRIHGIAFFLDSSWFILLALVIWSLSSSYFPIYLPGETTFFYFFLGSASALGFYLSLVLHELGHSVVSQKCGIPVPRITLSFIGGIAEIASEPEDPKTELKIALGGPAVTVILVLLYFGVGFIGDIFKWAALSVTFHWLAVSNLFLLIFNAVPGYPLDGGRVFRALLWMRSGRLKQATYISSRVGIGFGWLLILAGVFLILKSPLQAFVFFLIGSFLKSVADQGYLAAVQKETIGHVPVGQVMTANPIVIPERLPLNLVVDDYFFTTHHSAYPVGDSDGRFLGILRLNHVTAVPREKWPFTTAGDVLFASPELAVDRNLNAMDAARRMASQGAGRLAVVEDGRIIGIVTQRDILRFMQIHEKLA